MPYYKDMTWKDMEAFVEQNSKNATMLVPIGCLEEHGPHLPLATDSYLASAFSTALLKNLHVPIIIGPIVDFGVSVLTQGFSGTMQIDFKTLHRLIKNILTSCNSWGLRKVIMWTWHGGSSHYICLREAALDIIRLYPDLKVYIMRGVKLFDNESFAKKIKSLLESEGDHADELETSLMLHTHPELVVKDKLVKEYPDLPRFQVIPDGEKFLTYGIVGDATLATKEKGKRLFDEILKELTENVAKILDE